MSNNEITIETNTFETNIKVEIFPKEKIQRVNLNLEPKTIEELIKKHN